MKTLGFLIFSIFLILLATTVSSAQEKSRWRFLLSQNTMIGTTLLSIPPFEDTEDGLSDERDDEMVIEGWNNEKLYSEKPKIKGNTVLYIFTSGWGIGYTTHNVTFGIETYIYGDDEIEIASGIYHPIGLYNTQSYDINVGFYDFSYTLGDNFTFTFGSGILANATAEKRIQFSSSVYNVYKSAGITLNNEVLKAEHFGGISNFIMFGYEIGGFELIIGHRENAISIFFPESRSFRKVPVDLDTNYDDKIVFRTYETSLGFGFTF
jgi:hypothetical protein